MDSKNYTDQTEYTDVPIRRAEKKATSGDMDIFRDMRRIAVRAVPGAGESYIFYKQAKFMEYYTCSYDFAGTFNKYFPTYCDMSPDCLKGYFSWRTKLRNGSLEKTELSFSFVYIYELLHLIGCENETDGFKKLVWFFEEYGKLDDRIMRFAPKWLNDFVVYYNLPERFMVPSAKSDFEKSISALVTPETAGDDALYSAILQAGTYNAEKSAFVKKFPEAYKEAVLSVYRGMSEKYSGRGTSFCEYMMGRKGPVIYRMFESAVFYDHLAPRNFEYTAFGVKYSCRGTLWLAEDGINLHAKSAKVGDMLKNIDSIMRETAGFPAGIRKDPSYHEINELAKEAAERIVPGKCVIINEKRKAAAAGKSAREEGGCLEKQTSLKPEDIVIDVSKLGDIRNAADRTMEKLITEEELSEGEEDGQAIADAGDEKENADSVLDEKEREYARLLILGGDRQGFLKRNMIIESVIVDSINDKMFDETGDNVITWGDLGPVPVPDYIEDLRKMCM